MAAKKYLDFEGVRYLWKKIKRNFYRGVLVGGTTIYAEGTQDSSAILLFQGSGATNVSVNKDNETKNTVVTITSTDTQQNAFSQILAVDSTHGTSTLNASNSTDSFKIAMGAQYNPGGELVDGGVGLLCVNTQNKCIKIWVPNNLGYYGEDCTHRLVTDTNKTCWNKKSCVSVNGTYIKSPNFVNNYPTVITKSTNGNNVSVGLVADGGQTAGGDDISCKILTIYTLKRYNSENCTTKNTIKTDENSLATTKLVSTLIAEATSDLATSSTITRKLEDVKYCTSYKGLKETKDGSTYTNIVKSGTIVGHGLTNNGPIKIKTPGTCGFSDCYTRISLEGLNGTKINGILESTTSNLASLSNCEGKLLTAKAASILDTKVTQQLANTNCYIPLILAFDSSTDSPDVTNTVKRSNNLKYNPSQNNLSIYGGTINGYTLGGTTISSTCINTLPTSAAIEEYVTSQLTGAAMFKGSLPSANSTMIPYSAGYYWVVASDGNYGCFGYLEAGDLVYAKTASSSFNKSHFTVVQTDMDRLSCGEIDLAIGCVTTTPAP